LDELQYLSKDSFMKHLITILLLLVLLFYKAVEFIFTNPAEKRFKNAEKKSYQPIAPVVFFVFICLPVNHVCAI